MAELSVKDHRIAALCQSLHALNNEKAKISTKVSTAQGLWNLKSEREDGKEDRGIADGKTVEQKENREEEEAEAAFSECQFVIDQWGS